jgi:hypothetical protein
VEFSTGTILRPQFELAASATAYDRRPLQVEQLLCYRYTFIMYLAPLYTFIDSYASIPNANGFLQIAMPVAMRTTPTFAVLGVFNLSNCYNATLTGSNQLMAYSVSATAAGRFTIYTAAGVLSGFSAVAEI